LYRKLILAAVLYGMTGVSFALDKAFLTIDAVGGDIKIGPVSVYPSMKIITRHDDNIYESAVNEKSSPIVIVKPGVNLLLEDNLIYR